MEKYSYEEYQENRKKVYNDIFKNVSKENYEKVIQKIERLGFLHKKTDELAEEYFEIFNEEKCSKENKAKNYGYYEIIKYCLNQLKDNDKNLKDN